MTPVIVLGHHRDVGARGVSIRIFLAAGTPEGLWVIEKSNWTGVGLLWPRSGHGEARKRKELERPGIYLLLGPGESAVDKPRLYVGEADVLRKRLDQHHANKDFWTRGIAFTTKDTSLNKAHVKYLEGRLLALGRVAQRAEIDNSNSPALPALSEADTADMEAFLDEMLLLLPVLDVRAFEPVEALPKASRLLLAGPGASAEGRETADGFVVFAGSIARATVVPSIHAHMAAIRTKLVESGVVQETDEGLLFTSDYVFNSPSTAAGVLLGRAANGRIEWKDSTGRTLKELQTLAITG
jgi:hypothetical protein